MDDRQQIIESITALAYAYEVIMGKDILTPKDDRQVVKKVIQDKVVELTNKL